MFSQHAAVCGWRAIPGQIRGQPASILLPFFFCRTLQYADGAQYQGEFAANLPSGAGVLTTAAGDRIVASFADGLVR